MKIQTKLTAHLRLSVAGLLFGLTAAVQSVPAQAMDPQTANKMMQEQIALMQPEMQQRIKALSPQTKKLLLSIYGQHTRHSDQVTLRQVMHEVLADYHSMNAGILTDNKEQAADSARRLANHRIPRGGLVPYLKLELITDEKLSALASFNDSVEGNAKRLAEFAEQGEMTRAAALVGDITAGCVSCHNVFRGVPGTTDMLR